MDNINKWLTLLANLGVLAGIIFLAVELNQNNTLMTASAYQDRSDGLLQMSAMVIESELLSAALAKSNYEYSFCDPTKLNIDTLTDQERTVMRQYLVAQVIRLQNLNQQYEYGLLSDSYHTAAVLSSIKSFLPIWEQFSVREALLGQLILDDYPDPGVSALCVN